MMKWSPETMLAAAAVALSTGGSLTATAIHWGSTTTQLAQVEQNQKDMNQKLDQHQQEISAGLIHDATVVQKLDDLIDRLDRIEKKIK
jgi:transposase-like protein